MKLENIDGTDEDQEFIHKSKIIEDQYKNSKKFKDSYLKSKNYKISYELKKLLPFIDKFQEQKKKFVQKFSSEFKFLKKDTRKTKNPKKDIKSKDLANFISNLKHKIRSIKPLKILANNAKQSTQTRDTLIFKSTLKNNMLNLNRFKKLLFKVDKLVKIPAYLKRNQQIVPGSLRVKDQKINNPNNKIILADKNFAPSLESKKSSAYITTPVISKDLLLKKSESIKSVLSQKTSEHILDIIKTAENTKKSQKLDSEKSESNNLNNRNNSERNADQRMSSKEKNTVTVNGTTYNLTPLCTDCKRQNEKEYITTKTGMSR